MVVFLSSFAINAQTLKDFAKTGSYSVTYDEAFQPTLHLSFKNVSNKIITTIEVFIDYSRDAYEWNAPTDKKIVQVRVNPGEQATVHLNILAEKNGRKPSGYGISKVRYVDGSICDR